MPTQPFRPEGVLKRVLENNRKSETGKAVCIYEPRGEKGLEGYCLNMDYYFEEWTYDRNGKPYYRVYPCGDDYYETCSVATFNKFFLVKEAQGVPTKMTTMKNETKHALPFNQAKQALKKAGG